jgi:hypothetical protein
MMVLVAKGPLLPLVSIFLLCVLFLFFPSVNCVVADDEGEVVGTS